jgi:hypothetical protein
MLDIECPSSAFGGYGTLNFAAKSEIWAKFVGA